MRVIHSLEPIYDRDSLVLILGTIPSIKSREEGFYYAHPRNRFWSTLEKVFKEDIGTSNDEKREFLINKHIALFDVLRSCDISSSKDNSIKNPVPNDLSVIIENSRIKTIFTTGRKAYELYYKYCYPHTKIDAILLPSTSPANCVLGIEEKLVKEYSKILDFLNIKNE